MVARRVDVSEARRSLPELVRTVAKEGGRVDITYRGQSRVSLLRTSDLDSPLPRKRMSSALPSALEMQLAFAPAKLIEVIRALRTREGRPRVDWLVESASTRKQRRRAVTRKSR